MKVGIIQLTSVLDYNENLKKIHLFLEEAGSKKIEAVFLPECFYSMSDGLNPSKYLVEFENEHYENIRQLALKHELYILAGTAATRVDSETIVNRVYNFSPRGEDLGSYDKMNLFSCDIKRNGVVKKVDEGILYTAGQQQKLIEIMSHKIGLGVCVDVRYSQFSHSYKMAGAEILTFSSAFTVPTGKAHWHTLLKARAIENQCFVIAPAQWGKNSQTVSTYGHSLIIDPWGEILSSAEEGEKLIYADLDFSKIKEIEHSVIMHRS